MALDWSDERYVRLYTRDTTTWKLVDWRARTVLLHLLRKVDRAGVLDVGEDGVEGLAAVLELPVEIAAAGVDQLVVRGTVLATGTAYVLPNFLDAQEAKVSDKQRQRDSRERRRASALSHGVTDRHADSVPVTRGHTASQPVTLSLADPCLADPDSLSGSPAGARDPCAPAPAPVPTEPDEPITAAALPQAKDPTLVEHAVDRINAARREIDPAADPIDAYADPRNARALWDHLQRIPVADQRRKLDHAVDVMLATGRAEGKPLGFYRLGMLAGPSAFPGWLAGSVETIRASASARAGPRTGQAKPAASHGIGTIDPLSL